MFPEVEQYIESNYPAEKWRATLAEKAAGDINVVYLHNLDSPYESRILTYNSWYPGEFGIFKMSLLIEEIV